ncbi:MAG: heavy metal translocating P-type ATPase [Gemmatimonadetes bacterium]|nr:heavy metal translocating P-type ATPase [Gemmatimonadota bacterium]MCC7132507.1 heavy metal translocating P-type ATPase [Gemmatimonadales bacterium]
MRSLLAAGTRPLLTLVFLIAGLLAPRFFSSPEARHLTWLVGLVVMGTPIVFGTLVGALRGRLAADLVASLALIAAVVLGEPAAGLVIVLMQTGGEALEHAAARRASRAVAELEAQAPRIAHRARPGGYDDIPVGEVAVGDRILVRPGEMVPCDGVVTEGRSSFDTSRITGEPLPRTADVGSGVLSGTVNLDRPILIEATAPAATSLYHQIVELVRTAQASKAPLQRLADRAAVWFTPVTLVACALAYLISGDPDRVLAVLVVATPCPLILAAPVAMLGGINRAAREQVIVRHGTALEQLAGVDVAVFDKTGTLTIGHPVVDRVTPIAPFSEAEVLRLAGAVEVGSGHLLARPLVGAAVAALGSLPVADQVVEAAGRGVTGQVEGRRVTVGALTLLKEWEPDAAPALAGSGDGAGLQAYVAIDRLPAGTVQYADQVRQTAAPMTAGLKALGLDRAILLSGDRTVNALAAARQLGISDAVGDLLPQDKVGFVARLTKQGRRVMMVGDGANDAPALSAATVGVAIAAHGGGISAEAADIVMLTDDLTRIPRAIAIARRTMGIARQSIGVGLGLSGIAMAVAAAGYLTPIAGALLQEAIDVAVILNALRVLRPGPEDVAIARAMTLATAPAAG